MRAICFLTLLPLLPLLGCGSPAAPATSPAASAAPAAPSAADPTPGASTPAATAAPAATVIAAAPAAAAAAEPAKAAASQSTCAEGMTFVSGGEFKAPWASKPQVVPDLCVDTTETTAKAYGECADAGACSTKQVNCAAQSTFGKAETADNPMVCVDYEQATTYCSYRHKRLPTAAEWEWAARGGQRGTPLPVG